MLGNFNIEHFKQNSFGEQKSNAIHLPFIVFSLCASFNFKDMEFCQDWQRRKIFTQIHAIRSNEGKNKA